MEGGGWSWSWGGGGGGDEVKEMKGNQWSGHNILTQGVEWERRGMKWGGIRNGIGVGIWDGDLGMEEDWCGSLHLKHF